MKLTRIAPLALGAALLLTSCAGDKPLGADPSTAGSSQPAQATETPEPVGDDSAATDAVEADLLVAEIPQDCAGLGGEFLEDGQFEGGEQSAALSDVPPVFLDTDGDGAEEAIGVVRCSDSGHAQDLILVVGTGGALLDSFAAGEGDVAVTSLRADGETLEISGNDAEGQPTTAMAFFGADGKVTLEQPSPLDGALLKFDGYGPLRLGTPGDELVEEGWGETLTRGSCELVEASDTTSAEGIEFETSGKEPGSLAHLWTTDPQVATERGVAVGMSVDELTKIYEGRLDEGDDQFPYYYEVNDTTMTFTIKDDEIEQIDLFAVPFEEVAGWQASCEA